MTLYWYLRLISSTIMIPRYGNYFWGCLILQLDKRYWIETVSSIRHSIWLSWGTSKHFLIILVSRIFQLINSYKEVRFQARLWYFFHIKTLLKALIVRKLRITDFLRHAILQWYLYHNYQRTILWRTWISVEKPLN